jgi:multisubunit Na+/H+ antiporter MnhB subunit
MSLHHRHKQRILTTIALLSVFTLSLDVFLLLQPATGLDVSLLFAFTVAIGLITAYQCYNYRHSHEHLTAVNTLTQVFLGSVLFASCVLILILHAFFGVDIINSYISLSVIVVLLTFLLLRRFDEFLEREVGARFPMGQAPPPRNARKQKR